MTNGNDRARFPATGHVDETVYSHRATSPTLGRLFHSRASGMNHEKRPPNDHQRTTRLLDMYLHTSQATHVPDCPAATTVARLSPDSDLTGDIHYSSTLSSPLNYSNSSLTGDPGEPICLCASRAEPRPAFTHEEVSRAHHVGRPTNTAYIPLCSIFYRSRSLKRWLTNGLCFLHRTHFRSLHRASRCVEHGVGEV
jgi:hypothetical protein